MIIKSLPIKNLKGEVTRRGLVPAWTIDDMRIAGDFARARVNFFPTASSGVVRAREYDPIEARFDLVAQKGEWFIVGFKGPQAKVPTPLPEALVVDDQDTPETLVTRYMDVVLAELGPTPAPPSAKNFIAVSVRRGRVVSAKLEDMWVDTRDARRSFGQNLGLLAVLQPKSWLLIESVVTGDSAEILVTFEYITNLVLLGAAIFHYFNAGVPNPELF